MISQWYWNKNLIKQNYGNKTKKEKKIELTAKNNMGTKASWLLLMVRGGVPRVSSGARRGSACTAAGLCHLLIIGFKTTIQLHGIPCYYSPCWVAFPSQKAAGSHRRVDACLKARLNVLWCTWNILVSGYYLYREKSILGDWRCIKSSHLMDDLSFPDRLHVAVWAPVALGKLLASSWPAINLLSWLETH